MIYEITKSSKIPSEEKVEMSSLVAIASEMREKGARFVTITARDIDEFYIELIYHFELDNHVESLRLKTRKDEPIQSITGVYLSAFIAENEAQDLFKLKFNDLAVNLGGKMLKNSMSPSTLLKPAIGPQPPIMRKLGPCREACPAMVDIPKYLREISDGDPEGAYNTIIERAPLPAILGRVCFAPCQEGCRQHLEAKNLQIRLLKRFASDTFSEINRGYRRDITCKQETGKHIAVIGGGPSGLAAAYYLGLLGHNVTLYEKSTTLGGAMAWGIPKYRLPKDVMNDEMMARLNEVGAEIKLGTKVEDIDSLISEGYDAVFLGLGADECNSLYCEGEDSEGVINFIDFLTAVNIRNEVPNIGKSVIVIGGGNSAMDAARTAKRLGAEEVTIFYRRTEEDMPASTHEIHGSMGEGINFDYLSSQIKIIPGKPLKIEFQVMVPGEIDESGRRRPVPMKGVSVTANADTIISAIGYRGNVPQSFGIQVNRRGQIEIDEEMKTSNDKVWAGGDAVHGPTSVIEALRDGRKAADSIDRYLGGKGLPEVKNDICEFVPKPIDKEEINNMPQAVIPELVPYERVKSFEEIESCLEISKAIREAGRCWRCDWNE
jgi:NADPH-dependent glutamate synthase beta subunit-like oxidoreductase